MTARPIHPTSFSHLSDEELERVAYNSTDTLVKELARRLFDEIVITCPECHHKFDIHL